jgi:hypothetical protein
LSKQLGKNTGIAIVAVAVIAGVMLQNYMKGGGIHTIGAAKSYTSPADQAATDKLQPFIVCLNRVDSKLQKSIPGYQGYFAKLVKNPNSPPDMGGFFFGFKIEVYEQNNQFSKECIDGLRTAIAQQPVDTVLDASGKAYADTLEKLYPVLNEAGIYYDQGNYKDDKFAKGKELDRQIAPLADQLFAASAQIRNRVHSLTNELRERELAAMEKGEGRTFNWHTLNFMFQARRAIDGLDALQSSGALTADQVRPIEDKLSAAMDEGKQYAAAHSNEKTRNGNKPLWFDMENYNNNLITKIKELRRNLSANADQRTIEHDYAAVGENFNSLVKNYNMVGRYR